MNVHEYQAADLLHAFGVPVNRGLLASTPEEARRAAETLGTPVAIKAQVHTGGRGKAGGIRLAHSKDEAEAVAAEILGMDIRGHRVNSVLVVPGVEIEREIYLGVVLDRPQRRPLVMASAQGGVDIETVAREHPEQILRKLADPFVGLHAYQAREIAFALGLQGPLVNALVQTIDRAFTAFVELDATLVEINPLVVTAQGELKAIDSKMSFDDNALYRHPEIEALRDLREENVTELDARASGISYVKLDGTIGCIVNGAGLAMATMDAVMLYGGEPANFLDVGGGASADQVARAFELVTSDPNVRAILINIFGGITRGDVVAEGIRDALGRVEVAVPIVVRLSGTNAEEGRRVLAETGLEAFESMDDAAREVVARAAA